MFTSFLLQYYVSTIYIFSHLEQSRLGIGMHRFLIQKSILTSFESSVGSVIFKISSFIAIGYHVSNTMPSYFSSPNPKMVGMFIHISAGLSFTNWAYPAPRYLPKARTCARRRKYGWMTSDRMHSSKSSRGASTSSSCSTVLSCSIFRKTLARRVLLSLERSSGNV
jgi:hypothetical protein